MLISPSAQLLFMLQETRCLVVKFNSQHGRRRLYAPGIRWGKWLFTGNQDEEGLPSSGRKAARKGQPISTAKDAVEYRDEKLLVKGTKSLYDEEKATHRPSFLHNTHSGDKVHNARNIAIGSKNVCEKSSHDLPSSNKKRSYRRILVLFNNFLNWVHDSEDVAYAFKVTLAVFLVLSPAILPNVDGKVYRGGKHVCNR